jgi:hypothetical protein
MNKTSSSEYSNVIKKSEKSKKERRKTLVHTDTDQVNFLQVLKRSTTNNDL